MQGGQTDRGWAFHTIPFYDNILQDMCGRKSGIVPQGKEDGNVTCKTFSGMISSFLSGTLEDDSLREVINLSRDLPALVERERNGMIFRSRLGYTAYSLEILTILLVLMTVFIFLR